MMSTVQLMRDAYQMRDMALYWIARIARDRGVKRIPVWEPAPRGIYRLYGTRGPKIRGF